MWIFFNNFQDNQFIVQYSESFLRSNRKQDIKTAPLAPQLSKY